MSTWSPFRWVFARLTGLNPAEYRRRYRPWPLRPPSGAPEADSRDLLTIGPERA
jgi:hypothetical protein